MELFISDYMFSCYCIYLACINCKSIINESLANTSSEAKAGYIAM